MLACLHLPGTEKVRKGSDFEAEQNIKILTGVKSSDPNFFQKLETSIRSLAEGGRLKEALPELFEGLEKRGISASLSEITEALVVFINKERAEEERIDRLFYSIVGLQDGYPYGI